MIVPSACCNQDKKENKKYNKKSSLLTHIFVDLWMKVELLNLVGLKNKPRMRLTSIEDLNCLIISFP